MKRDERLLLKEVEQATSRMQKEFLRLLANADAGPVLAELIRRYVEDFKANVERIVAAWETIERNKKH